MQQWIITAAQTFQLVPLLHSFTTLEQVVLSTSNHRQKHHWAVPSSVMKAVPNAGRKLTLTLHWSTLRTDWANANNWEVMDSNWTVSAQPGGISLHTSYHTQTLYQCLWTRGQFECDWGTQWMWHWRRRPIGSYGSMTHYGGGYRLCFLHLIQHWPLKALIGV